jgi:DNA-binding NarL/FixJ family response regulator
VAHILLLDHNPNIRLVLKALIESHAGWHVYGEASDGQEGVDKAIMLKPDLVIVDFSMPILNGLQVASKILEARPSLPIILCTIHFFPEMIAEAKKVGIREVVNKSDAAGQLLEIMENLLKEQPASTVNGLTISPQPELTDTASSRQKQITPRSQLTRFFPKMRLTLSDFCGAERADKNPPMAPKTR